MLYFQRPICYVSTYLVLYVNRVLTFSILLYFSKQSFFSWIIFKVHKLLPGDTFAIICTPIRPNSSVEERFKQQKYSGIYFSKLSESFSDFSVNSSNTVTLAIMSNLTDRVKRSPSVCVIYIWLWCNMSMILCSDEFLAGITPSDVKAWNYKN